MPTFFLISFTLFPVSGIGGLTVAGGLLSRAALRGVNGAGSYINPLGGIRIRNRGDAPCLFRSTVGILCLKSVGIDGKHLLSVSGKSCVGS